MCDCFCRLAACFFKKNFLVGVAHPVFACNDVVDDDDDSRQQWRVSSSRHRLKTVWGKKKCFGPFTETPSRSRTASGIKMKLKKFKIEFLWQVYVLCLLLGFAAGQQPPESAAKAEKTANYDKQVSTCLKIGATTFSITTLVIMPFSIKTISIKTKMRHSALHYAECRKEAICAECLVTCTIKLFTAIVYIFLQ